MNSILIRNKKVVESRYSIGSTILSRKGLHFTGHVENDNIELQEIKCHILDIGGKGR